MVIRKTIKTETPKETALYFSAVLAADRGYTSEVRPEPRGTYLVIASDGQAVRFSKS